MQKPAFPTLEAMQYSFFPAQTAAQRIVWKRPVPAVILPKTSNAIQPFRNNTQIFRKVLPTNPQITRNVGNTPSAVVKQRLVSVGNTPNTPNAVGILRPASVGNTPSAVARPASVGNTPSAVGIQRPASVVNQRPNMPTRAWVSAKTKPVSQSALDLLSAKLGTFREISQVPKYVKRGCGCRRN